MRRAVAPLLLALAIVSPLLAQSPGTSGPTTRYSRLYVFGDSTVRPWRAPSQGAPSDIYD